GCAAVRKSRPSRPPRGRGFYLAKRGGATPNVRPAGRRLPWASGGVRAPLTGAPAGIEPRNYEVAGRERRPEVRRRGVLLAFSSGTHGFPVRSSIYRRIKRRTTCEGVASSSAQRRSKSSFLRGSIRIVSRAVRSSIGNGGSHEVTI